MSTVTAAAAAVEQHQQRFSSSSKRKSAVELLAESRAAFYVKSDKLRDQPDRYITGRDEDRTSSHYVLVSPSRSLPHPLLPRRHSAFSRLPPFSGSSAENSPSPRGPNSRTTPPRVPKSLNASPRNAAQFNNTLSYPTDFDIKQHIDNSDLTYNKNSNNLAYNKKSEPYFEKNSSVLFSNLPYKNKRNIGGAFNNNVSSSGNTHNVVGYSPAVGSVASAAGDDLQNKLRKLLGCEVTDRRRSLGRKGLEGESGRDSIIKEPGAFRSGVGSCEDLLLGGAISPPAEYASSPQVLRSARYKGHHQHNSSRSHHSRRSQRDEGFHESHKSLPDLYARTRADEEELIRQRGYDTSQYYDESSSPQDYDRQLYREGNRSSGVYKSNSSCNRSNSSCNRSNSSCNRSTSSCNNRDSGGSSGHFTHSRSSEHASTLPPLSTTPGANHNSNLLTEPYRRDSGSSTQHSYDNSYHSINHTTNNPVEYTSHKYKPQEDYNSLDYRTDYNNRFDHRYTTRTHDHNFGNKYDLTDHKVNVYNSLNYKPVSDKYNHKSIYSDHNRSNYYQPPTDHCAKPVHPSDCDNNTSRYTFTHHEGYHHNSNRYMMNMNHQNVYEGGGGDICCDENCEIFAMDGQAMQFERDCVECQRMLYEHRQHLAKDGTSKKKKSQQQFDVCDCDPATVFQVPEQFQDDYIQDAAPQQPKHTSSNKQHSTNIFAYEQTTYLTTMTTTMTTDYRKDFHNSGSSSLPPLNEGFVQNEKVARKPGDGGFIRETFISTPHRGESNKERCDGYKGGPLSPPLGTFKRQRCLRYKNKCSSNSSGRERDSKPVIRSKSDISDRYCNNKGEKIIRCRSAQQPTPPSPLHHQPTSSQSAKSIDNQMSRVESFFDRLGLSDDTFKELMTGNEHVRYNSMASPDQNSKVSSPPVFFSDTSTVDSLDQCVYDYTNTGSNNAPVQNVVRVSEPPSVVERNARIIKWLCNCRKMQLQ
ncbi:GATA zinc finger domain-containing protein 14-like [Ctenocephalides felis]|uniref:GATA zinc finger domain-containing protein 14-like n=1 Tax=Ctenocephalides felis TaxID=7515 RepID=UPI000E6E245F|nr:GATA zinc finger domain-containing protein 14-like [Ctenocephalides felis]